VSTEGGLTTAAFLRINYNRLHACMLLILSRLHDLHDSMIT
jgi:hypothetical protein